LANAGTCYITGAVYNPQCQDYAGLVKVKVIRVLNAEKAENVRKAKN
jgi:hypothetical protein